jgi:hypothetical protein
MTENSKKQQKPTKNAPFSSEIGLNVGNRPKWAILVIKTGHKVREMSSSTSVLCRVLDATMRLGLF